MKKLLFVATAALCATVFGAIESTNVVGYQGNTANTKRHTMMAPTFLSVSSTAGCTLADLKVTGYTAPAKDEYGMWDGGCTLGAFILKFLNNDGSVSAEYYWVDDGNVGPAWCDGNYGIVDASEVSIPAGSALWVKGSGYSLQSAGAVNKNDISFAMNTKRHTAVGNSMPIPLTLDDLTVEGYDAPAKDEYGMWDGGCTLGAFILKFLNNDGSVSAEYYWVDDGNVGPAWCDGNYGVVDGTEIAIPAGKGFWVKGSGYKLNIPAPEL